MDADFFHTLFSCAALANSTCSACTLLIRNTIVTRARYQDMSAIGVQD